MSKGKDTDIDKIYLQVESLISTLRNEKELKLSSYLHSLLHGVSWTTGSECLNEVARALDKEVVALTVSNGLINEIKGLSKTIRDFLAVQQRQRKTYFIE